jgi:hypothetical protein
MSEYRIVQEISHNKVSLTQLLGDVSLEEYKKKAKEMGGVVVDVDDLPDSQDRDHWVLSKDKVIISPESIAREMTDTIRMIRDYKLTSLDLPSMRAMEDGDMDTVKDIKKKKDVLRELPSMIEDKLNKIINSKKKPVTKLKELKKFHVSELDE